MDPQPASPPRRRRFQLAGVVQGVGFPSFVFRLASELGLAGWVLNDESGGDSGFLYPFLGEQETDLDAVLEDVRASVRMKADEVSDLRRQTLQEGGGALAAAAAAMRRGFDGGGTLLVLGTV